MTVMCQAAAVLNLLKGQSRVISKFFKPGSEAYEEANKALQSPSSRASPAQKTLAYLVNIAATTAHYKEKDSTQLVRMCGACSATGAKMLQCSACQNAYCEEILFPVDVFRFTG